MNYSNDNGFTLIEVLIAMLIVTFSVIGALKLSGHTTQGIELVEHRTEAYFVSMNVLTRQLMGKEGFYLKSGTKSGTVVQGTHVWPWLVNINKPDPALLDLVINVFSSNKKNVEKIINVRVYNNAA